MKPPEEALKSLVSQWVTKAGRDCDAATRLLREGAIFREIVGFHSQQAAEKYLKALLVRHQIQFPRTHDLKVLHRLADIDSAAAKTLSGAEFLTPFGVEVRYPGDASEMLPGDENKAVKIATKVREAVMSALGSYLS